MKIKKFNNSDGNLKDWFVWIRPDGNIFCYLYSDVIALTHKTQLNGVTTPCKDAKAKKVSELDMDVMIDIIIQQSNIITDVQLHHIPPPHPHYYSVRDGHISNLKNINKDMIN